MLADEEVRSLIRYFTEADGDGDTALLIIVLAATGARFSQVRRLQVQDVQPERSRIMMPSSRKRRSRRKAEHVPIQVGHDVIAMLHAAMEGRQPTDILLNRWRHVQTGPAEWQRTDYRPWLSASEIMRPWKSACKKLGLTQAVPYALRHSSIVRGLRANLPIRLVADARHERADDRTALCSLHR
jgi:integrase